VSHAVGQAIAACSLRSLVIAPVARAVVGLALDRIGDPRRGTNVVPWPHQGRAVETMRPIRARLSAATMEVRMALVAVWFELARPVSPTVELRPGPNMAHPSRSPQGPPHRSSQAHPGPTDGPGRSIANVAARSRRGSAIVAIALASGVIVLVFGPCAACSISPTLRGRSSSSSSDVPSLGS
jgi:hypothetical protein